MNQRLKQKHLFFNLEFVLGFPMRLKLKENQTI